MIYKDKKPAHVKKTFSFEGVNFNHDRWKGTKVDDFVEHEKHHGLSETQLREAHALMNKSTVTAAAAEAKKDSGK